MHIAVLLPASDSAGYTLHEWPVPLRNDDHAPTMATTLHLNAVEGWMQGKAQETLLMAPASKADAIAACAPALCRVVAVSAEYQHKQEQQGFGPEELPSLLMLWMQYHLQQYGEVFATLPQNQAVPLEKLVAHNMHYLKGFRTPLTLRMLYERSRQRNRPFENAAGLSHRLTQAYAQAYTCAPVEGHKQPLSGVHALRDCLRLPVPGFGLAALGGTAPGLNDQAREAMAQLTQKGDITQHCLMLPAPIDPLEVFLRPQLASRTLLQVEVLPQLNHLKHVAHQKGLFQLLYSLAGREPVPAPYQPSKLRFLWVTAGQAQALSKVHVLNLHYALVMLAPSKRTAAHLAVPMQSPATMHALSPVAQHWCHQALDALVTEDNPLHDSMRTLWLQARMKERAYRIAQEMVLKGEAVLGFTHRALIRPNASAAA